jgi:hypothetical protein
VWNDSTLTYKYTILNNGDSPATEVKVVDSYDTEHLKILESSVPYTVNEGGDLVWQLGKIPAGGAVELTYDAVVRNADYSTEIANTVSISARETDNNIEDNTDEAAVRTISRSRGNGVRVELTERTQEEKQVMAALEDGQMFMIERATDTVSLSEFSPSARQTLLIRNISGESVPDVVFHDILTGPDGTILQDEVWDLGMVLPYEEIELGYTIHFGSVADGGRYTLTSTIQSGVDETYVTQNGIVWFAEYYEDEALVVEPDPLVASVSTSSIITDGVAEASSTSVSENLEQEVEKRSPSEVGLIGQIIGHEFMAFFANTHLSRTTPQTVDGRSFFGAVGVYLMSIFTSVTAIFALR